MKQAEMIHEYNRINRPKFNPLITRRSEDDIINEDDVNLSVSIAKLSKTVNLFKIASADCA